MKFWYLIYYKSGQLSRTQQHLERQSISFFTPMVNVEKILRGKRTIKIEPLFPHYLFVHFDPEEISLTTINSTRGVSHFIRFGHQPTVIAPEIILTLQSIQDHQIIDCTPKPGDQVLITDGIFKGLEAIFIEPGGETRSLLLLDFLDKHVSYRIDNNAFKSC